MKRGTAAPASSATPARQVAGFIAKFDPKIARLLTASRRSLRRKFPTAVELVYDNYNALAMGLGPKFRLCLEPICPILPVLSPAGNEVCIGTFSNRRRC